VSGKDEITGSAAPAILRNTSYLLAAQILATPLAIILNALAARSLGPGQYGIYYQALTFASFAFLFVEWGQSGVLTKQVAAHRDRAGEWLGSGLAIRSAGAGVAIVLMPGIALLMGESRDLLIALMLALCGGLFGTVAGACQDVYRGYERLDFAAACVVGWQLLIFAVAAPVLLAGGRLHALMLAQTVCAGLGAAFVLWMVPRMRVPRLVVRMETVRELYRQGHSFLVFSLVLALQPLINAGLLSRMASDEELGWYAVAGKLVGILVIPANALLGALYPALCRLYGQNMADFRRTTADALHAVAVVGVPAALGCALFPEIGIAIFGKQDYAQAEGNLRILAPWMLLCYFSMPIGSCLTAAGRQTAWTIVLLAGVVTATALNPFLIRWFQDAYGNGGLGVCLGTLLGEIVTLGCALCLLPAGVLPAVNLRRMAAVLASGGAMYLASVLTSGLNVIAGATLSVLVYALCAQLTGGVDFRKFHVFPRALKKAA
jgi:O-antigen/teichoic acid export membrane protein